MRRDSQVVAFQTNHLPTMNSERQSMNVIPYRTSTTIQKSYADSAKKLLREFQSSADHVQASALVSADGLIITSVLSDKVDADRFGAMCASLLVLATRTVQEVQRGVLRQIILDGELGPMLLTRVGQDKVLAVAASPGVNLGMAIIGTRRTARSLADLGD